MGTMNKMRENTGIILWILVISFGGLWVLQDSGVFDTIGANPLGKVIVVNGDPVTQEEYQRQLESQLEQVRQQTGNPVEPQQLETERDRAFNALVNNRLLIREMDRLGIVVSDQEIQDLITGENPHQIIRSYFADEEGGIDRAILQNVIDDPEQEATWIQIEEYIRLDRRRQKFDKLISATVRVSDRDIQAAYDREQSAASAEFFFLRYAEVPDSSVTLTDRDVERFYNDHKEDYRKERLYSIAIASLSKDPASEDTLAIEREAERLLPEFEAAENDSLFLIQSGSAQPYSDNFLRASDLPLAVAAELFETGDVIAPGLVVGPVIDGGSVHLVKVRDTRPAEETAVRARHILIRASEDDDDAIASARDRIQEFRTRIRSGEDFAELAANYSDDPGSRTNGGDLGWFGEGVMVKPFEEAALGASVGALVGPVETQHGVHLIEVTHRGDVEVQIAHLRLPIDASVATLNTVQETLDDLRFYAEESGDFAGEAERRAISIESLQMQEGQQFLPSFGLSLGVARFLETAETGAISPIIELNEASLVVHVVDIEEEGYQSLEDVEGVIRQRALLAKKKEVQRERLEQAYQSGGFDGLNEALGMEPQAAYGVNFQNQVVPDLGRDPVFAGTVLGLTEGEDSGVVDGENAVFVARVTDRREPEPLSDDERDRLREQLTNDLEQRLRDQWINALRDRADIQDLRTDMSW